MGPLQLSFSTLFKLLVTSLGLTVWNLLGYTRIENAHKVRKKTFVFYYVAVIYTNTGGTEQIRARASCYDQSA